MKENQTFREGLRGCFISLACIFLAMGAVIMSAKYVYPQNPYCGDMVGAGFPVMFICDNWGEAHQLPAGERSTFLWISPMAD